MSKILNKLIIFAGKSDILDLVIGHFDGKKLFLLAINFSCAGWSDTRKIIPNLRPWSKITTAPTIPLIINDKIIYKVIDKLSNKMTFVRFFLIFTVLQYLFFAKLFGITKKTFERDLKKI
jgi:hypothetical protein